MDLSHTSSSHVDNSIHTERRNKHAEGERAMMTGERKSSVKCLIMTESAYLLSLYTLQAQFPLKIILIRFRLSSYC